MKNKYKFSVIVPVYNVENYVAETLDSVINQTIGFKDNIQLIIVNDGSPDNSDTVCKKYRDMYPDNIVYVEKENGGVSAARNEGIKHIEGKYTAFLDGDDKWDLSALGKVYAFFEKHYDEIDAVSCRVMCVEAQSSYHGLDFKFNAGTRIADINNPEEYCSIQTLITPVVTKTEAVKNLRFDTRMICGEDTYFYIMLVLEKCKIGFLKEALYYYRVRNARNSACDKIKRNKFFYDDMLEYYHFAFIRYSKEKFGKVIPYVQATIINDLMWHFSACETHEVLSDEEFAVYRQKVKEILSYIDDDIIFNLPNQKSYTKRSVAVNMKHGIDYFKSLKIKDNKLWFRKYSVFNFARRSTLCVLNSLGADKNKFRVEVLIANWLLKSTADGGKLVLKVGDRFVKPKEVLEYAPKKVKTIDGGEFYYASCVFNLKLRLKQDESVNIMPHIIYGEKTVPIYLNCTKDRVSDFYTNCRVQGNYIVGYKDGSIQIRR